MSSTDPTSPDVSILAYATHLDADDPLDWRAAILRSCVFFGAISALQQLSSGLYWCVEHSARPDSVVVITIQHLIIGFVIFFLAWMLTRHLRTLAAAMSPTYA